MNGISITQRYVLYLNNNEGERIGGGRREREKERNENRKGH